jgi:hypothetical protein
MAHRATILAVAILVAAAAPAHAGWTVFVYDRDQIRSATLMSTDRDDQQFALICTTLDGERFNDPTISLTFPSPRQFGTRPGDLADVVIQSATQEWTVAATVSENDSSGFSVSSPFPAWVELVGELETGGGDVTIDATAGSISLHATVGTADQVEAASQFMDACGR